ncbi:MAG TPA: acyltransferase family protein [Gemmatimonadales bacterium]|nr:acyltransferase family protein [Gemmatimonadales bacterium]
MTTTPPARTTFNPEIQGLRAIAILLVVAYHAHHSLLPGGYIGVDVFFVISGFLITGLLAREAEATRTIQLTRFYARRARRLLPAAMLVLIATVAVVRRTLPPFELKSFSSVAISTALYVGNFWFAHIATDYLRAGEAHVNPLLHYWSLCVEEQFYLIWPALILLVLWGCRKSRRVDSVLIATLLGVGLVSLLTSILVTKIDRPWAFFATPARAWEFACGGVTGLIVRSRGSGSARFANTVAAIGIACIAGAAFFFDDRTAFPGYAALLPVCGASLVLAVSTRDRGTPVTSALRARPLQILGDLSYSWYLWHWPVMLLLRNGGEEASLTRGAAGAVISLGLAWLTFHTIENPIRESKLLIARSRLSIAGGLALAALGASTGLVTRHTARAALDLPAQRPYESAVDDIARVKADGCHLNFFSVTLRDCVYGRTSADSTMMLIGDSHAEQWFPAAEAMALRRGWRLISLTKAACPPFPYQPFDTTLDRPYVECTAWQEQVVRRVASTRPTLVIIGLSSGYDLHEDGDEKAPLEIARWRSAVRETLNRLRPLVGDLVLLRDTPVLTESAPACLSRAAWLAQDKDTVCRFSPVSAPTQIAEQIAVAEFDRSGTAEVVDMGSAICPDTWCGYERGGLVLFHDNNHLTATFSRTLGPELDERITLALRAAHKNRNHGS